MSTEIDGLEDRVRRLGLAVADATVAAPRSFDELTEVDLGERDDGRRSGSTPILVLVAAAAVVVALVAVIVAAAVAHRDDPRSVTTNDTTPGTGLIVGGDLPRLAPAVLPAGYVLDRVEVRDGGVGHTTWIRKFVSTTTAGDVHEGDELSIMVSSAEVATQLQPPITNPDASKSVDVGGRPGWINYSLELGTVTGVGPGPGPGDQRHGVVVRWTTTDGTRLDLETVGLSEDQALAVAGAVRVAGSAEAPTADIDPTDLPPSFQQTYAGDDFGAAEYGSSNGPIGTVSLVFRDRSSPARYRDPHLVSTTDVVVDEVALPAGDVDGWLRSFGASSSVFSADGMSFVIRPVAPTGSWEVVGSGHGALVTVRGNSDTGDDQRAVAAALRPLDPAAWTTYLGSAVTVPVPARVEVAADTPTCSALRALQDRYLATSQISAPRRTTADQLRSIASQAPAPVALDLRTLADALVTAERADAAIHATTTVPFSPPPTGRVAPMFGHDQIVALRTADQDLDGWARSHCAAGPTSDPIEADRLGATVADLRDQDPALDAFCRAYQTVDLAQQPGADGRFHLPAAADALDPLLALLPESTPDLRAALVRLRDRMREVPDGEAPKMRSNDPLGIDNGTLLNACPDWPR